jgi:hypothetical protein
VADTTFVPTPRYSSIIVGASSIHGGPESEAEAEAEAFVQTKICRIIGVSGVVRTKICRIIGVSGQDRPHQRAIGIHVGSQVLR